jgi:diguanylate cyclase (GGDEF)-like protein
MRRFGMAARLLCWLAAGFGTMASAALPSPLSDYYRDIWTTREGLPHNTINAIAQTDDGYLWFATWEGPTRFNGREFTVLDRAERIGLPDVGIRALLTEPDGSLILGGARGGLARGQAGEWRGWEPAPGTVLALHRDRLGRLWVGTEVNGLLRIDPDGGRRHYEADQGLAGGAVLAFLEDDRGRLWIGSSAGLSWLEGDSLKAVAPESGLPSVSITALQQDAQGRLLVGTEQGIFVGLPNERFEPLSPELAGLAVSQLLAEADGSLWIGTSNAGLMRIGVLGTERFGVEQGLPNSRVLTIFRDREDSLWIGTNAGLMRLRDAPMVSHTRARGLAGDYVRSVMRHSDGGLWVGSSEGLSRIDEAGIRHVGQDSELARESVLSLAEADNGDLWIGTFSRGVWRWDGSRVVERLDRAVGLPSNEVRAILPAADGSLWLGTSLGVAQWRDGVVRVLTEEAGLPGHFVFSLMQDRDGGIWIGTGAGAAVYRDGVLQRLALESADGAAAAFAFWQDPGSGDVWIASDRGLIRWRASDASLQVVGRDAGLPFDKLFSVVPDHRGNLWLSANRGVLRVARSEAEAVADGRLDRLVVDRFGESDGMASSQCNGGSTPAATLAQDGSVWFATSRGAVAVQPARLARFAERPPPVVIERASADGRGLKLVDGLQLPAGVGRVQVEFAGLGFVMPERLRYRYRLDGFDQDWVERGALADAELTNLPPGDYRFRVVSAYADGDWSPVEATWRFSVAPYWWQRTDVRVLSLLAAIGLLAFGVRMRTRQLHRRGLRLRALVEQRTADLNRQAQRLLAVDAERNELLERLREQSEASERQAREDALTGLPNRRAFDESLAEAVSRARLRGEALCLVLLDVDHFKRINDQHSHMVGDAALRAVGEALASAARPGDSISRWGGEEFALLLPDTSADVAVQEAERLRQAIAAIDGEALAPGLSLTASFGVALDVGTCQYDRLVSRADAAMYRAKQSGRNRVCLAD